MPNLPRTAGAEPSTPSPSPLSVKQVTRLFGGDDTVATLLLELDMGAYVDSHKVTRIGFAESEVHEHDRWVAEFHPVSPKRATSGDSHLEGWYLRGEDASCAAPSLKRSDLASVIWQLRYSKTLLREVRVRLLQINDSYVDAAEVIAAASMLNSYDVNDLVDVDYTTSTKDLHQMVHHTEDFIADHPDYAGIKRSNLLALYGLADPYRDYHRALVATPTF